MVDAPPRGSVADAEVVSFGFVVVDEFGVVEPAPLGDVPPLGLVTPLARVVPLAPEFVAAPFAPDPFVVLGVAPSARFASWSFGSSCSRPA